jgi:hypothetical protein
MRFGEKLVVFILRPIYRTFFERLLWWFLARMKAFFLAETSIQLSQILRKLENIESMQQQRWAEIEARLRAAEANNAAQWDGLEQLLLAMFRQTDSQSLRGEWEQANSREISGSSATDLNRAHAASSIR